jgi:hypothetical protein
MVTGHSTSHRVADDYPEVDDYGRRFRWEANHSTGKYVRVYAPAEEAE